MTDERDLTRRDDSRGPIGSWVGPYLLLESLGEGGMGEVYLARQDEPLRRQVALKLIKLGMDSRKVVARFELERQTLALMAHPGIARVFDAGTAADGRPYFAMEFVRGTPITDYCDRHRLSTSQRLAIFLDVCDAVQHAHQRGVIHRDLKPSNVLVEIVGDKPTPKIIDFGVAKATFVQSMMQTMFTEHGQLIGTPEYMSPEQAEMTDLDVDTRTDIYSLGVLLYELLVGVLPFDSGDLRRRGLEEIRRILREEDPPRPSTRLSGLQESTRTTIERHRTGAQHLRRELSGDLDWITMRAMEKDRTRRYPSASELAMDVRRYLRREPVEAGPPTATYRFGKFLRRNRAMVLTATAITLLVVAGSVVSTWQAVRAYRAEQRSSANAELADAVNRFLLQLLERSDPSKHGTAREMTVREAVDAAAVGIDEQFRGQPALESEIRRVIGSAYLASGEYAKAERQFEGAWRAQQEIVPPDAGAEVRTLVGLASVHRWRGDLAAADLRLQEAARRAGGVDSGEAAAMLWAEAAAFAVEQGLLTDADVDFERARDALEVDGAHATSAKVSVLAGHGSLLTQLGKYAAANNALSEALQWSDRLGPAASYARAVVLGHLGVLRLREGQTAEAVAVARDAVAWNRRVHGEDHPLTAGALRSLGDALRSQGDLAGALVAVEQSVAISERVFGRRHVSTAQALDTLGQLQAQAGNSTAGEALVEEALSILEEGAPHNVGGRAHVMLTLGTLLTWRGAFAQAQAWVDRAADALAEHYPSDHWLALEAQQQRGQLLAKQGAMEEAKQELASVVGRREAVLGPRHPGNIAALAAYAGVLREGGSLARADSVYRIAVALHRDVASADSSNLGTMLNDWAVCQQAAGDLPGALDLYKQSLAVAVAEFGEAHPAALTTRGNVASILREQGDFVRAEREFAAVLSGFREVFGDGHPSVATTLHNHASTLLRLDRLEEAEEELRAADAALSALLPPDNVTLLIVRSTLGYCLGRRGEYEEGVGMLLKSHEGVLGVLGPEHARVQQIRGYLVEIYGLWEKPDQVAKWN